MSSQTRPPQIIELGDAATGSDSWQIGGTASLSGRLGILLLDGFIRDDTFDLEFLVAAGGLIGLFDDTVLPALIVSMFRIVAMANFLRITAVPLPGAVWLLARALVLRRPRSSTRRK